MSFEKKMNNNQNRVKSGIVIEHIGKVLLIPNYYGHILNISFTKPRAQTFLGCFKMLTRFTVTSYIHPKEIFFGNGSFRFCSFVISM